MVISHCALCRKDSLCAQKGWDRGRWVRSPTGVVHVVAARLAGLALAEPILTLAAWTGLESPLSPYGEGLSLALSLKLKLQDFWGLVVS